EAAKADSSLDPYQRKEVVRYMRSEHTQGKVNQQQRYDGIKQQAVDYYFSHDESIDGLPAELKAQLKPQDFYNLSKKADQQTDLNTWYNFVTNPKSLSTKAVYDAFTAGKLSR